MTDAKRASADVGSSWSGAALAAIGICVIAAGVAVTWWVFYAGAARGISIATGASGGTYHEFGRRLARVLEQDKVVEKVRVIPTDGSAANMGFIGAGSADFAFVQSDTAANGDARLVATLYEEVLHVLVAKKHAGTIRALEDLAGRPVYVGGLNSGTLQVARRVLGHFGVAVAERVEFGPAELPEHLGRDVDAAFVLTAIPSSVVKQLTGAGRAALLSIGQPGASGTEADALETVYPYLHSTVIPRGTYARLPAVNSIRVTAQLIANRKVEESTVRAVTGKLYESRGRLAVMGGDELPVARHVRERFDPTRVLIPYHRGAESYYNRSQPHFLVEYAEAISLGASATVGIVSGLIALREWRRRRRKNRIDEYYVEVRTCSDDLRSADRDRLVEIRIRLEDIRRRAFRELIDERLAADESFTIFQDFIRGELAIVYSRLNTSPAPPARP